MNEVKELSIDISEIKMLTTIIYTLNNFSILVLLKVENRKITKAFINNANE